MLIALIVLYAAVQAGLLVWGHRHQGSLRLKWLKILVPLACAAVWRIFVTDSAFVLMGAPLKSAVVLYNLVPLLLAVAVAFSIAAHDKSVFRTVLYGLLLVGVDFYFWGGAFYTPFKSANAWDRACCLQTSEYSCGAAAAATLLKLHGVDTTEGEMMKPCLTSLRGTSFWGLYHGLREMADPLGKRVVVRNESCEEFIQRNKPAILFVMLDAELDKKDPRFSRDWGWQAGIAHAVVYLGKTRGGRARIADPRMGMERWDMEGLKALWRNRTLYIE